MCVLLIEAFFDLFWQIISWEISHDILKQSIFFIILKHLSKSRIVGFKN
jgi:hypothetical protein